MFLAYFFFCVFNHFAVSTYLDLLDCGISRFLCKFTVGVVETLLSDLLGSSYSLKPIIYAFTVFAMSNCIYQLLSGNFNMQYVM